MAPRELLDMQRLAFRREGPPSAATRKDWINRLIGAVVEHKNAIPEAIDADFSCRSPVLSMMADAGATVASLKMARDHLDAWSAPVTHEAMVPDAIACVEYHPLGVVGVMSPWNFPINLALAPLAGILAAGNRCIIKPSEHAPHSAELIARIVRSAFDPAEVAVITGSADVSRAFASLPFDHLLFTGGTEVGRKVMAAAAENLVPVTLELGGKCPVIISTSAAIADAAARVMTIKTTNAGQICLAPDYVLLPEGSEDAFAAAAENAVHAMYPTLVGNPNYTAIINDAHAGRIAGYLDDARAKGGRIVELNPAEENFARENTRKMPPALVLNVTDDMVIMQEEIFGPLLPVKTYKHIDDAIAYVAAHPAPLALYYFGNDNEEERRVLDRTQSGGVTINDVMTHAFAENLPFGGIGASGIGAYHGQAGFIRFSHARSIYRQGKAPEAEMMLRPPFADGMTGAIGDSIVR